MFSPGRATSHKQDTPKLLGRAAVKRGSLFQRARKQTCVRPNAVQLPTGSHAATHAAALRHQELQEILRTSVRDPLLLDIPNPFGALHVQLPSFFTVLGFLLENPLVTLALAVFLYLAIPRLWRAFVKYIVVPASLLGTGYVVVKNPQTFSNAGNFINNFSHDHPYVTSATILVALGLILSPYLLTGLLVLFLATGIPRLPAPVRNFLPAPFVEFEQSLVTISDLTRGPVDAVKSQAVDLGSQLQATGTRILQYQIPQSKPVEAPSLRESSAVETASTKATTN